ncbi:MAG: hypothetical protein ACO3FL_09315 [Ilumatobacteraceae bacterium]
MAHFAKIENNTVTSVIVVSNDDCGGGDFPESEPIGQAFLASLGLSGEWLQTSYHANFRGRYAAVGHRFDADLGEYGEFVPSQIEPINDDEQ